MGPPHRPLLRTANRRDDPPTEDRDELHRRLIDIHRHTRNRPRGHETGEVKAATRSPIADGLTYGPALLGATAVGITATLLAFDLGPLRLSERTHAGLSALPLAIMAIAYLAHQPLRRPSTLAVVKAALLASAFLLWAAYQLNPTLPLAVNDLAITLFVLDIALVIATDIRTDRIESHDERHLRHR